MRFFSLIPLLLWIGPCGKSANIRTFVIHFTETPFNTLKWVKNFMAKVNLVFQVEIILGKSNILALQWREMSVLFYF